MRQKLRPLEVLVGDESDGFRALPLVSAEKLGFVAGEITDIDGQEESMASIDVILVVTVDVTVLGARML